MLSNLILKAVAFAACFTSTIAHPKKPAGTDKIGMLRFQLFPLAYDEWSIFYFVIITIYFSPTFLLSMLVANIIVLKPPNLSLSTLRQLSELLPRLLPP